MCDILPNPSPVTASYPCTVCLQSVSDGEKAIECSGCEQWTHAYCAGVSEHDYEDFCTREEFDWFCSTCLFDQLPQSDVFAATSGNSDSDVEWFFGPSVLSSTYDVLSSSFNGIRVVHHNVQGIQSKMTEITGWLKQMINTNTIFCLTKTWLSSNSPPICVEGFHIFVTFTSSCFHISEISKE